MRSVFSRELEKVAAQDPRILFLTNDLGFMAFESLRAVMGDRFINAGVAEQNLISTAAGLASEGWIPLVYSIAPFLLLRPFEQIRNDIGFHRLPVKLIGNGGGYGYGGMGHTHHSLEDLNLMRLIPGMKSWIPTFQSDLPPVLKQWIADPAPGYLRLGRSAGVEKSQSWSALRKLQSGKAKLILSAGVLSQWLMRENPDAEVWAVQELPTRLSDEFVRRVEEFGEINITEDVQTPGGLSEWFSAEWMSGVRSSAIRVHRRSARYFLDGRLGSEEWCLREAGVLKKDAHENP